MGGGRGVTHQGLGVLFRGAVDTGGDVMVLTLLTLWPSGSLAWGRMLAIQFKFRHTSGVSTTARATLGGREGTKYKRVQEGRREEYVIFYRRK